MTDDPVGLVGTIIADKYRVERVVGEGGFAVVYRAEHMLWKRPVALKVFKALADLPTKVAEGLTDDFIREGALLAELSEKSTSICQARDVGTVTLPSGQSVPYMVLEWLEGESLEDALQREQTTGAPLRTLEQAMALLDPIAEALALAHARGIAHRDVKPANIFLLGDARGVTCPVKLLDFGIAKVVQDIQKTGGSFSQTGGSVTSFTPAYAAPEQFSRKHGPTGPWTDVFALALVVVELLTGKAPLEGDSFLQIGFAAGDPSSRPTPRARGAETSDAVETVFLKALAVEPSDRYPSLDVFWRELHAATLGESPQSKLRVSVRGVRSAALPADALGQTAVAPAMPVTASIAVAHPSVAPSPTRRRRVWLFALVGLPIALGLAALGRGLVARQDSPPEAPPAPFVAAVAATAAPASVRPQCPADMAFVRGGASFVGSDDGTPAERPAHKVEVSPYCMDVHEVTTAKYLACSNAGLCKRAGTTNQDEALPAAEKDAYDSVCNARDPAARAQHPINCVTWEMADVYCRSNQKRLPTEAEWEFAARGSDGRTYPWGDAPPSAQHLNACGRECIAWGASVHVASLKPMYQADDRWPNTAPVGSFPQGNSQFGVEDLAGNVWEWVSDWYGPYTAGDGVRSEKDPVGPAKGTRKVIRGGAWNGSEPSWERPSFRYWKDPAERNYAVGFRCAASPLVADAGGAP